MNYFVIMPDGSRYGPTDIAGLNAWAKEGRLLPATRLEEEGTGRSLAAHELLGLEFPASQQQWSQPPQGYYRAPYNSSSPAGNGEFIAALVLGIVTIISCCPVLPGFGLWMANKAVAAGHPSGNVVRILNIVMLVATILFYVVYIGFMIFAVAMGATLH
jgi:hypothetical protein